MAISLMLISLMLISLMAISLMAISPMAIIALPLCSAHLATEGRAAVRDADAQARAEGELLRLLMDLLRELARGGEHEGTHGHGRVAVAVAVARGAFGRAQLEDAACGELRREARSSEGGRGREREREGEGGEAEEAAVRVWLPPRHGRGRA